MRIKEVKLIDLETNKTEKIYFDDFINIIIGPNGSGKTRLLNILNRIIRELVRVEYGYFSGIKDRNWWKKEKTTLRWYLKIKISEQNESKYFKYTWEGRSFDNGKYFWNLLEMDDDAKENLYGLYNYWNECVFFPYVQVDIDHLYPISPLMIYFSGNSFFYNGENANDISKKHQVNYYENNLRHIYTESVFSNLDADNIYNNIFSSKKDILDGFMKDFHEMMFNGEEFFKKCIQERKKKIKKENISNILIKINLY